MGLLHIGMHATEYAKGASARRLKRLRNVGVASRRIASLLGCHRAFNAAQRRVSCAYYLTIALLNPVQHHTVIRHQHTDNNNKNPTISIEQASELFCDNLCEACVSSCYCATLR